MTFRTVWRSLAGALALGLGLAGGAAATTLPSGVIGLGSSTDVFATVTGAAAGDRLGMGVTGGGDFNGDGFPDVAVAAPGAGKVYLLFGGGGFATVGSSAITALADVTLTLQAATGSDEHYALAFTDLDNDTVDDLIVGAPYFDNGASTDQGRVYVVYGRPTWTSTLDLGTAGSSEEVLVLTTSSAGARLGMAVAGGRDGGGNNSSGIADLLIGAPGDDKAYVVWGRSPRPASLLGSKTIATAVSSAAGVTFSASDAVLQEFGSAVAFTPQVSSGSALASVLVGAPAGLPTSGSTTPNCGATYLFLPGSSSGTVEYTSAGQKWGAQCGATPGTDPFRVGEAVWGGLINNDAYAEIVFGAPLADVDDSGRVFLRFGSATGPDVTTCGTGAAGKPWLKGNTTASAHEALGYTLAASLIDADLRDDLLIGSPQPAGQTARYTSNAGQIYVFLSVDNKLSSNTNSWAGDTTANSAIFVGEQDGDGAGWAVSSTGDVFNTGFQGMVFGAPFAQGNKGRIYIYLPYDTTDADGDSKTPRQGDCDDDDPTVKPGLTEACNLRDDDCDGRMDEGVTTVFYLDGDEDGYGDPNVTATACTPPEGYTFQAGDCADGDPLRYPTATERCNNLDDNCNGQSDEGVTTTYYYDNDGDGWGNTTIEACTKPTGTVTQGGDCNDNNAAINPETKWYLDVDQDGYGNSGFPPFTQCSQPQGYVANATDCDDNDTSTHPTATEKCDAKDNDCNGALPANERDTDSDGYLSCSGCTGTVECGDCNDSDAESYPGLAEDCDLKDNDCDAKVDEGVKSSFYGDEDEDGYGDPADVRQACSAPNGYVSNNTDCDDTTEERYPGNPEVCDGVDNNCDAQVPSTEADGDSDGFRICNDDCDDADAGANPGETEVCDDSDNNCDGVVDEGFDADGDTYYLCTRPSLGHEIDCDDAALSTYPGAPELCDGEDNDCDGTDTDEQEDSDDDGRPACAGGVTVDCRDDDPTVFANAPELCDGQGNGCVAGQQTDTPVNEQDLDQDGYLECTGCTGGVLCDDCQDQDGVVYPGRAEACDEKDNDCDASTDEGVESTFWLDDDGDGFGDPLVTDEACEAPTGFVDNGDDCDDGDTEAAPSRLEVCDGKDNNCDGLTDEGFDADGVGGADCLDEDGDGYNENRGDCDDEDATIFPGGDETTQNGIDNDCDLDIDEDATDVDGDGYVGDDCDDADPGTHPDAAEVCDDAIDNNCNGATDEGCDEGAGYFPACDNAGGREAGWLGALMLLLPVVFRGRVRPGCRRPTVGP